MHCNSLCANFDYSALGIKAVESYFCYAGTLNNTKAETFPFLLQAIVVLWLLAFLSDQIAAL